MHARTVVSTIISIARWSTSIDTDIRLTIVCRFARTHRGTTVTQASSTSQYAFAYHAPQVDADAATHVCDATSTACRSVHCRNCLAHGTSPSPQDRTCAENRSRTSAHSAARSDDSCGQPMPSLLHRNGSHMLDARRALHATITVMRHRGDIRLADSMRNHRYRLRSCSLSASA